MKNVIVGSVVQFEWEGELHIARVTSVNHERGIVRFKCAGWEADILMRDVFEVSREAVVAAILSGTLPSGLGRNIRCLTA